MAIKQYKVLGDGFHYPHDVEHAQGSIIEAEDDVSLNPHEGEIRTAMANGQLVEVFGETPVEATPAGEAAAEEPVNQEAPVEASASATDGSQTSQWGPFEVVVEWYADATPEGIQEAQAYIQEIENDLESAEGTAQALPASVKSILVRRITDA